MRLYPRDRDDPRARAGAGSSSRRRAREVSTGPGRHDFEIVVDPALSVEDDMRRRDFTINAMARRLGTGELVDPFGGRGRPRGARPAHGLAEELRARIRCGSFAALRFVSQLGFEPDEETLAQMRERGAGGGLVSGERIGGGLAADGMGELSKLLLGAEPAKALRLARDTGVLVELLPEFGPAIGFDQESRYHDLTVDEHTFAVVQAAADQGFRWPCGSRRSSTTSASRRSRWRGNDGRLHYYAKPGYAVQGTSGSAPSSRTRRCSGCGIRTTLRKRVVRIVRRHMFQLGKGDALPRARLAAPQRRPARVRPHRPQGGRPPRQARQRGEPPPLEEIERLARFREVVEQERRARTGSRDLAIDGNDLIELGYPAGPQLGRILHELLDEVVRRAGAATRATQLLTRAKERL